LEACRRPAYFLSSARSRLSPSRPRPKEKKICAWTQTRPTASRLRLFSPPTRTSSPLSHPVALGLESIATPLDRLPTPIPGAGGAGSTRQKAALAAADEAYESSDLLRSLKERSAANAARNRKAIQDKYCYRQAELGIGDCGGLRYVPGATKSGKQKTPKALLKLLGKSEDEAVAIQAAQEAAAAAAAAAKEASSSGGE
jgi:hypothetical protein